MRIRNKLFMAIALAGLSSQAAAVQLGEFNGTKLSLGGYIKAEGIYNMPKGKNDRSTPDRDPAVDEKENTFIASARQTRFHLTAENQINDVKLKGYLEVDFWDDSAELNDSTYAPRIRHAYMGINNLTIGQTWAGQFFGNAPFDVNMINFWGPGTGTIGGNGAVIRPDLVVSWNKDLGAGHSMRLTAQDPVWDHADIPDLVASYTFRTGGHAFNLTATGREVGTDTTDVDKSKFGAAISAAAKFQFGSTTLIASGYTGEGAGIYAGWGSRGGATGDKQDTDVDANGKLITTTGLTAGITQKLTEKLSATVRYGQVKADVKSLKDKTLKMTNVNLVYNYLPQVDFGVEWRNQNAGTRPPASLTTSARPHGQQVEVFAMYKF